MAGALEITQLLREWAGGNQQALNELTPLVYAELRRIAAGYLRHERPEGTLQPTVLVNEAYVRLVDQQNPTWRDRSHFYGVAAHLMREIMVDHARRRKAGKRAGHIVALEEVVMLPSERGSDLLALDCALNELEKVDARKCKAVELHYFGGLTTEEIAQTLDVSPVTVRRDLRVAEMWLYREMRNL